MTEPKPPESGFTEAIRKMLEGWNGPSGFLKPGLTIVKVDPDECVIRGADVKAGRMVCGRRDHPTATSDCATTGRIRHCSEEGGGANV